MKKIVSIFLFIIYVLLTSSCSTYSIKTDIENNALLSKIEKTSIILRISRNSKITKQEQINNTLYWLSNYQKKENISVIANAGDSICYYKYPQEKFYQLSNENNYLKYKSIGVVNLYLQTNRNELINIISENNLDGLIIFEIYSVISTEMQFFGFDSVLAITDSNLNIAFLDHQTNNFESESMLLNDLKNQIMDKINERLMKKLQDLDLLGDKTEGAYDIK